MRDKKIVIYEAAPLQIRIEKDPKPEWLFYETIQDVNHIVTSICARHEEESGRGYEYPVGDIGRNNIVLFSADRGQGKTSVLLSYAYMLQSLKTNEKSKWRELEFPDIDGNVVFPVIDPSSMESQERLIDVVLSVLYQWYECIQKKDQKENAEGFRALRGEIAKLFQQCYRNSACLELRPVAQSYDRDELNQLSQMGSIRLHDNLQKLVCKLLELNALSREASCGSPYKKGSSLKDTYLVLCIDDMDLATRTAYRACEDVRRYLSLEHVIVLMAADFQQLFYAIEQEYIAQYEKLLQLGCGEKPGISRNVIQQRAHKLAAKYIEKVFPVTHRIELPAVNDLIRVGATRLTVEYFFEDSNRKGEIAGNAAINLQKQLIEELYLRTGILLKDGHHQMNPFLPVNLRELVVFYSFIIRMDKVAFDMAFSSRPGTEARDSAQTAALLLLESNIKSTEDYFYDYWCPSHLSASAQRLFEDIRGLSEEDTDRYVQETLYRYKNEPIPASENKGYYETFRLFKCLFKSDEERVSIENALKIRYTLLLNRRAAASWTDEAGMRKLGEFIRHSFMLSEEALNVQFGGKYFIFFFDCDPIFIESFDKGESKIDRDELNWLRRYAEVEQTEERDRYSDYLELLSDRGTEKNAVGLADANRIDWDNKRVKKVLINILDVLINVFRRPNAIMGSDDEIEVAGDRRLLSADMDMRGPVAEVSRDEEVSGKGAAWMRWDGIRAILLNVDVQYAIQEALDQYLYSMRDMQEGNLQGKYAEICKRLEETMSSMYGEMPDIYPLLSDKVKKVTGYFVQSAEAYAEKYVLCNRNNRREWLLSYLTKIREDIGYMLNVSETLSVQEIKEAPERISELKNAVGDRNQMILVDKQRFEKFFPRSMQEGYVKDSTFYNANQLYEKAEKQYMAFVDNAGKLAKRMTKASKEAFERRRENLKNVLCSQCREIQQIEQQVQAEDFWKARENT